MAKISNTSAYPFISALNSKDYLILTDADNSLLTKTVLVATLSDFIINTGNVKLISPDNTVWRLEISNAGVITAQPA